VTQARHGPLHAGARVLAHGGADVWACVPPKPKLLDQVRDAIRTRHYSYRTEEAYTGWIRRFILFHHKRHPAEMGRLEITQFLTALAVERHVSASTQNQALAALLFLYQLCSAPHNWYYVQLLVMWSQPPEDLCLLSGTVADST
jgi:hypothetical protein